MQAQVGARPKGVRMKFTNKRIAQHQAQRSQSKMVDISCVDDGHWLAAVEYK
jgi:hypothetical protein